MQEYNHFYLKNSNVLKLKAELEADGYFNGKVVKVKKYWNEREQAYTTQVTLNVVIGVNESMLRAIVFNHDPSDPLELEEEYLRMRKIHGEIVVERFRLMAIASGVSGQQSLELFNLLNQLASMLRMGLLSDTKYLLSVMQGVPLLDMPCILNPNKTVRNYFIDLIEEGNATTEELS